MSTNDDQRGVRRYAEIRRIPGSASLLAVGVFARLGIGMTPLGIVLLVDHATADYLWAGCAGGAYAFGTAVAGPVHGRLADRIGARRALIAAALAHSVGLAALVGIVHRQTLPAILAASAFAGATYPMSTAAIRSAWSLLTSTETRHHHLRDLTLAAETAFFELVFVAGPMVNAGCLAVGTPVLALATSGVLTCIGTIVLAKHPALADRRRREPGVPRPALGPLVVPAFKVVLAFAAVMGLAFGAVSVAVPAYATAHGGHRADELAALLLTSWNLGSVAGSFHYGARARTSPLPRQLAGFGALLAVSTAALAVMPTVAALAIALAVSGLGVGPTIAIYTNLTSRTVPANTLFEAHNWLATLPVGANAAGMAVAGAVSAGSGSTQWTFLFAGAALFAGDLLVIGHHRRSRPSPT